MNNVIAVTTMSKQYYDTCGKYAIQTFQKYWKNIVLHVYREDTFEVPGNLSNIVFHSIDELDNGYFEFIKRNHNNRIKTFSIKAFVLLKALEELSSDYLVWHDADLITKKQVTPEFFKELCANNLAVYNGIDYVWDKQDGKGERIFHSCDSGFFILNNTVSSVKILAKRYKQYYMEEITDNLKRFYDNDVLGNVIIELEQEGIKTLDLNKSSRNRFSPMNMKTNILQPFFTHFKGGKKEFKPLEDLVSPYL